MTKDEAKAAVLAAWRALPTDERQTEQQAALFALSVSDQYRFRCSGDRYQHIKGWLQAEVRRWPRDVPVVGTIKA